MILVILKIILHVLRVVICFIDFTLKLSVKIIRMCAKIAVFYQYVKLLFVLYFNKECYIFSHLTYSLLFFKNANNSIIFSMIRIFISAIH